MSHTVHGLLRKAPFTKDNCGQDGQSKMYVVELSEMTKDYQTGEKAYSNYKAMLFAKSDAAKGYYDKALAEGSFIVLSCEKLKVEQREHEGKTYVSLMMESARLEGSKFDDNSQPQQNATPQQAPQQRRPAPQPQEQQTPQQNFTPDLDDDWSDDIPF